MKQEENWLFEKAAVYGISLHPFEIGRLVSFANLVFERACPLGLSGRKSIEEILQKDILDSLLLGAYVRKEDLFLDIGSGAGFPGIPLKILLPSLRVTLLEARQKAVAFLRYAVAKLDLSPVQVEQKRAETVRLSPVWKGCFDAVVGRAIAPLHRFVPLAAPFLKPGGKLILQKGKKWKEELKQARSQFKVWGLKVESVHPGLEGEQKILLVYKH